MGSIRSIEPHTDAVGRTGWDILHSSSRALFLLAFLIVAIIALYLFRDDLPESDVIRDYAGYLLPLVLGLIFGRWLYWRYLRQFVIVQVEDPVSNIQREYEVSLGRFQRMTVEGLLNPVSTSGGVPLYRVLDFDTESDRIRAGWCHDPRTELAAVMVSRECWESLVSHDHDMTVRAEYLEQLRYQETISDGHNIASGLLDALKLPRSGAFPGSAPDGSADGDAEEVEHADKG